ncbi:MAG: alpha/beta fold hydrolase, partial [Calditrichaeota bacterium]
TLSYELQGSGPTLLLLHAFPLNRTMWTPQVQTLSSQFQLLTPDLPGFGESDLCDGPATMQAVAEAVHALLRELAIQEVVVGGLSMGGYVAFEMFRQNPQTVRGLILADTRAEADTEEARANRRAVADRVRKTGSAAFADEMTPKLLGRTSMQQRPELVAQVREMIAQARPEAIAGAQLGMALRPDSTATLRRITCPTLVLVGEEDALTPPAVAEAMQRQLPRARLAVIPRAGHLANLENPAEFNLHLREFLRGL